MSEDTATRIDATVWAPGWPHEAPDHPMSVKDAHLAMQRHYGCDRGDCPRKAVAWQTLVEAGRIRPDSSRQR